MCSCDHVQNVGGHAESHRHIRCEGEGSVYHIPRTWQCACPAPQHAVAVSGVLFPSVMGSWHTIPTMMPPVALGSSRS